MAEHAFATESTQCQLMTYENGQSLILTVKVAKWALAQGKAQGSNSWSYFIVKLNENVADGIGHSKRSIISGILRHAVVSRIVQYMNY